VGLGFVAQSGTFNLEFTFLGCEGDFLQNHICLSSNELRKIGSETDPLYRM
jgi:hypothetical protein